MADVLPHVVESVQQLADTWRRILTDRGSGDVRDLPGMAIRWADSKFPFWNCITFTDRDCGEALLDDRLAEAAAYMRYRERPGLIWLFEDLLSPPARAGLPAAVDRAGLTLSLQGFGMAGDFPAIAEPQHPELEFVRVTTEEHLLAYADLNSRAYGMPLEAGRDGLAGSRLWKSEMYSYLGVMKGQPVSAAATVETNGCLLLALVATAPEAQRRGYGEAMVRKALFEGFKATGATHSVLHATLAGMPVYERVGYHKAASISFYGLAA